MCINVCCLQQQFSVNDVFCFWSISFIEQHPTVISGLNTGQCHVKLPMCKDWRSLVQHCLVKGEPHTAIKRTCICEVEGKLHVSNGPACIRRVEFEPNLWNVVNRAKRSILIVDDLNLDK
jgi:hypothetical protein